MTYSRVAKAVFLRRPNRFIAQVEVNGKEETVHVKNTGRCKELLVPGCTVYLSVSDNPLRKTKYDLVAVEKIREGREPLLVNMDSQLPNDVVEEWLQRGELFQSGALIRREVTYGDSRFDFYIEDGDRKAYLEVKGCTLEDHGHSTFPDAPTERGVKHIQELMKAVGEGYSAYILFVIQMEGMVSFSPNWKTHPAFGEALIKAKEKGVNVLAYESHVTPDSVTITSPIPVLLRHPQ
ncbi:MAG: DNA/RNA nuclease SfsA [Spirochaetales bacterium]|nr:DNA/RNA nuclease SfsA [Candidatus Physcosoma equi]